MIARLLIRAARLAGFAGGAFALLPAAALAANLQILPVRMEIRAPEAADTFTLRNNEPRPLSVQVRIFSAVTTDGVEQLEPTRDVVVSPPITTLQPGADYQVRVVRTKGEPVTEKESYRLIVDELPDPERQDSGTVNFAIRYSLPVTFLPGGG